MPSSPPGSFKALPAGTRVVLVGLEAAALNGVCGSIERFITSKGRYAVDLGPRYGRRAVRPLNLQVDPVQLTPEETISKMLAQMGASPPCKQERDGSLNVYPRPSPAQRASTPT